MLDRLKPAFLFLLSLFSLLSAVGLANLGQILDVKALYGGIQGLITYPLLLPVFLFFVYLLVMDLWSRRVTMTLRDTDLHVIFDAADGSGVRINREQKLLVHRPGVNAYHMNLKPDPEGAVPRENMEWCISGKRFSPKDEIIYSGTEKGWDIMHLVEPSVPYQWWYTFVPSFLRRDYITRIGHATFIDCFRHDPDYFEFNTERFPHKNVTIKVTFHRDRPAVRGLAQRIRSNSVIEEELQKKVDEAGRRVFCAYFENSRNERLRVTWWFH